MISKLFREISDIINFNYSEIDFENLADIWPETAKNIVNYFRENKEFINKYLWEINIDFWNILPENQKLSWLKFCITWSFENISRDDTVKLIEENWWEFVTSVGKSTNYLIAWEKAGSKIEKAQSLWVQVLSLEEFMEII